MKKTYGVSLKPERKKVRPASMDLRSPEGRRVVLAAAKRVMNEHADVIRALATR